VTSSRPPSTTTDSGIPAQSDEYSLTVGRGGPTVLHVHYLVQKMQHVNRERVPERVVHAKGSGAHGFFEVTGDVTWFTHADFLGEAGRQTPIFARFSTVAGEQGYTDTDRDPRGFALKFYTEEGNFHLVGNNTPVFFIRDASKFSDFIHTQKRLPDSGLRDKNMQWDFWTLSPESAHQVTKLMSDRGTPRSVAGSVSRAASPSATTSASRIDTAIEQRGSRATLRPFRVPDPVWNQKLPSSQSAPTAVTCGLPSSLTVESHVVRAL